MTAADNFMRFDSEDKDQVLAVLKLHPMVIQGAAYNYVLRRNRKPGKLSARYTRLISPALLIQLSPFRTA